ncbi:phage regulatory CII family protein [uncultured Deefgea sp.]|uniref:phage regulatory CII family protein n=1 Tax=uncultured Deefgea sp. TaxID=1304914 RepID=UPI002637B674|nr:phage regulatory CII family protein [uncultured Deefgea sp.]
MDHTVLAASVIEAARADCALWRGGQEDLSRVVTGYPQTLRHKLTGHNRAVLGVDDALSVMELTNGRNIIAAMARQLGGVFIQLPAVGAIEDNEDLMLSFLEASAALGELARKAQNAVGNDGHVDVHERSGLLKSAHELHGKVLHYLTLLDRVYGDAEVQAEIRKSERTGMANQVGMQ